MSENSPMAKLICQIAEALRDYDRLAFDEEYEHKLGEPCKKTQIDILEGKLGRPLSPGYKLFLELHNGWENFAGDAKLLSVEEQDSELVAERLLDMEELFPEFDQENPFQNGALPIMLGEDSNQVLYIDPTSVRPDGEMDFVLLDITTEEHRFPDFTSFLAYKLNLLNKMIQNENYGDE